MLRRHTEPGTPSRQSYDEAIRRHLLDLGTATARALLRGDTNGTNVRKVHVIVTSDLAYSLLKEAEHQGIFAFLTARLHVLSR